MTAIIKTLFTLLFLATSCLWATDRDNELLIVSNYPEKVSGPGLVFDENVTANHFRLMYYHENSSSEPLFVRVTVNNMGDDEEDIQLIKGLGGSDLDGLFAGHVSTKRFLQDLLSSDWTSLELVPGRKEELIYHKIKPNQVASGILKLRKNKSGNLKIKMHIVDPKYFHLSDLNSGEKAFTYGYFRQSKIKRYYDYSSDLVKDITVGSEPFLEGEKNGIVLQGNYAVFYDVTLNLLNPGPGYKKVNVYFSPAGGVARGLVIIDDKLIETKFFDHSDNLAPQKIHHYTLAPQERKQSKILTMPQAGSFYPVHLVLQSEGS